MFAKFELKENVVPVFNTKRNVPLAELSQISNELENMGVILKVEYSDWASPAVYIKKKSKEIRACADFSTGLNDALKTYHYPLLSPEAIFARLNNGKMFSKLDFVRCITANSGG